MFRMTYDLFGAWSPTTGINAPLHDQSWGGEDTIGFSIDGCTKNWIAGGGPPNKINIGLPFYGRSFRGATGMNQEHDGKADDGMWHEDEGSPQYYNIVTKLEHKNPWSTDQEMHSYRHEETSTQYAWYNIYGGVGLVSYDDEEAICDKTEYCVENDLNGFIIWEISGDLMLDGTTPLIDAVHAKLQDPQLDCEDLRYEGTLTSPSFTPTVRSTLRPTRRPVTSNPTKRPEIQTTYDPPPPQTQQSPPPSKTPTPRPTIGSTPRPSPNQIIELLQSSTTSVQIITPKPTPKPSQQITKTNPPTKPPSPRPTIKTTPIPTPVPTPRPTPYQIFSADTMALHFVSSSASAFAAPSSPKQPRTPRPTRMPQQRPTPQVPTSQLLLSSKFSQENVHVKGQETRPQLNRPMKKKAGKKQKKMVQYNGYKKGAKKKMRPTHKKIRPAH